MVEPYYGDFLEVAGDRVSTRLFDFAAAADPQFSGVDVVVEHGGQFSTPEMWNAGVAAHVKLWQVTATGLDKMDVAGFLACGIPLANMPGSVSTAIPLAEHVLALMLALA